VTGALTHEKFLQVNELILLTEEHRTDATQKNCVKGAGTADGGYGGSHFGNLPHFDKVSADESLHGAGEIGAGGSKLTGIEGHKEKTSIKKKMRGG
jgi:hypothetical protein